MTYQRPVKRIITKEDLDEFLQSDAYKAYIGYIERLNDAVRDCKIDSDMHVSEVSTRWSHPQTLF